MTATKRPQGSTVTKYMEHVFCTTSAGGRATLVYISPILTDNGQLIALLRYFNMTSLLEFLVGNHLSVLME